MSFAISDVVLLPIPFSDLSSRKVRPAIIVGLSSHPGDLFLVPVSSQIPKVDLVLNDWQAAGLNVRCGIKSQIATVESRLVVKKIGTLSSSDQAQLQTRLRAWL